MSIERSSARKGVIGKAMTPVSLERSSWGSIKGIGFYRGCREPETVNRYCATIERRITLESRRPARFRRRQRNGFGSTPPEKKQRRQAHKTCRRSAIGEDGSETGFRGESGSRLAADPGLKLRCKEPAEENGSLDDQNERHSATDESGQQNRSFHDGTRIVYSSHRGSQYNNLYLQPAEGGEPYQLTFGEWDHFEPRWSPDGEWIVYVSNEHGLSDLRLLRTFGGEEKKIEIRDRVWKRPMGTLEVTVRDGAAGPATEAKVMW